jgi:acetyl-CoA carboxylase alpha subunit
MSYKRVHDLIDSTTDFFLELSGDRIQWEDKKLITGLARIGPMRAMIISTNPEKTPHPEAAFRKGCRMIHLAERMGCRILLFLGTGSGAGWWPIGDHDFTHALNEFIKTLIAARVPVITVRIGEMDEIERLMDKASESSVDLEGLSCI